MNVKYRILFMLIVGLATSDCKSLIQKRTQKFEANPRSFVADIRNKLLENGDLHFTYRKLENQYRFRNALTRTHTKVQKHIGQLERIPDHIQSTIRLGQGQIIFFSGVLTDHPEMTSMRGQIPRGWPDIGISYDDLGGAYVEKDRSVLLGIDGNYQNYSQVTLHEYGHMFDHIIGMSLYGESLSNTDIVNTLVEESVGLLSEYEKDPREFIATMFKKYYFDKESNGSLKMGMPKVYYYFAALELFLLDLQMNQIFYLAS